MKIIIGLGNPGEKYKNHRHNFGFMAADFLAQKNNANFVLNKKLNSEVAEFFSGGQKIILAKPQTFMNNSGQAVKALLNFYKAEPKNIIIIHDDTDLAFGQFKQTVGQGAAGHNGIASVIGQLKTTDFYRLRLGIRPTNFFSKNKKAGDLVLKKFSFLEKNKLEKIIEQATQSILN